MEHADLVQASIEYLRYLEQCVADLKAQKTPPQRREAPMHSPPEGAAEENDDDDDDDDDDEEMDEDDDEPQASTPVTNRHDQSRSAISLPPLSQITEPPTSSPSGFSVGEGRHYSISSTSQASYSPYFHSNQTSPAFGPQLSHVSSVPTSAGSFRETFGLGSPALKALDSRQAVESAGDSSGLQGPGSKRAKRTEHELDHEATAALLMLNHDRRSWNTAQSRDGTRGSGMSVRDLLSG